MNTSIAIFYKEIAPLFFIKIIVYFNISLPFWENTRTFRYIHTNNFTDYTVAKQSIVQLILYTYIYINQFYTFIASHECAYGFTYVQVNSISSLTG